MEAQREKRPLKHLQGLKGRVQNSLSGFLRACIVAVLVAFQFAILIVLPFLLRQYASLFYLVMELFGVFTILALTNDSRSMSYKYGWLCITILLPVSGNIMFALWGKVGKKNKLNRRIKSTIQSVDRHLEWHPEVSDECRKKHPVSSRMSRYMEANGAPISKNNEARYYDMGENAFEDLFADLERAKKYVFIEFFIVAEGAIWDKMHDILKRKIEEGVEVKFLYDDFGALLRTSTDFAQKLRAEGFEVEVFNPIHKYTSKLFMNFRDHQKILVIDGEVAYTGGFNIADEYANLVDRFGIWKDEGVRLKGDVVWSMVVTFLELWAVCSKNEAIDYERYRAEKTSIQSDMYCHVLRDGPALDTRSFVGSMYKQMIHYAGEKMYVMTPYLILEEAMIETLLEAVRRGVDVRIITPHIPDKKHIKYMTEYNYGILLKNGIRIYEYEPGFIHSKVVMNEHCAIVGTINMDYRSFYLHYENGVWIYDEEFRQAVENDFINTFAQSIEITYEDWKNRPLKMKIIQPILHVFDALV